jgi:SAM-dependent methyltransferase
MITETPTDTTRIDAVVARLKATPGVRQSLPELSVLRQSGPFQSVNHFFASSFEYFRHLLHYTNITPESRVMDFGCGLGRMAIPFSVFLDKERGFYCGLDTDGTVIERDKAMFAGRPTIEFRHVDVFNKHYNPTGRPAAEALAKERFDAPFDVAFLFSVFTHILSADLDTIVGFLAANLAPKGEIFSTWFLIDDATQAAIDAGKASRRFATRHGTARIDLPENPEAAVAYPLEEALAAFRRAGFTDVRPHFGTWRGKDGVDSWLWQDGILARR